MDALVRAAREEGALNVSGPPGAWDGGYQALISGFELRFGLHASIVVSGDSADQVDAVTNRAASSGTVPDVLALDPDVAQAHTSLLAPYLVFYWLEIPSSLKNSKAYWYDGCGGYMSIGYDSSTLPAIGSVADLLRPAFAGAVGLDGDPTRGGGALGAVMMASMATGGSADEVAPGVRFFHELSAAGNLLPQPAAPTSGGVVVDWDYVQREIATRFAGWKFVVPPGQALQGYFSEAVNRNAPHPAAARLWEEYLSSDAGQNLCLVRGARPARMAAMRNDGVLDVAAAGALGTAPTTSVVLTPAQMAAARAYVVAHWTGA